MHGSLALKNGVLYVGRHAQTAYVCAYDLDGQALRPAFSFRGSRGGRASIAGLAVDHDHRIWVADDASARVRAFTAFGQELDGLAGREPSEADQPGHLGRLAAVACSGVEEAARIHVASAGRRRHALQVFDARGRFHSLRPEGDPSASFRGIARIAVRDRMTWVCEPTAGRVQVFRDDQFHYPLGVAIDTPAGEPFVPRALTPLSDGRLILAHGGARSALLLLDRGGRLTRILALSGTNDGEVSEPSDVAVDESGRESSTRIAVIDCDGDRIQVFTLEGRCLGAFPEFSLGGH